MENSRQTFSFDLWQKEQSYLKEQAQTNPELFSETTKTSNQDLLKIIGIQLPDANLPTGVIKYNPFDFIVEEIGLNRIISTTDFTPLAFPKKIPGKIIHCDLVKIGISTIDAVKQLAKILNISEAQIGFAGIKDAFALTSQRISLERTDINKLSQLEPNNFFLKNITTNNGVTKKGELLGNRFTILVRTTTPVQHQDLEIKLQNLKKDGFWNFYGQQRFGDRLLSHKWGAAMMRGNYREVIYSYLCDSGYDSNSYFSHIRGLAKKSFGNWKEMIKIFSPLPYKMRHELILLNHLAQNGKDYVGALKQMPEQITLWVYAFTSYLANQMFSNCIIHDIQPPEDLPLALSDKRDEQDIYQTLFKQDRVPMDFARHLTPFNVTIRLASRSIKSKIKPQINQVKIIPEGVVLNFDLPKGCYATTFLSHLFSLEPETAAPNLPKKQIDLKQILGLGSVEQVKNLFKEFIIEKPEENLTE